MTTAHPHPHPGPHPLASLAEMEVVFDDGGGVGGGTTRAWQAAEPDAVVDVYSAAAGQEDNPRLEVGVGPHHPAQTLHLHRNLHMSSGKLFWGLSEAASVGEWSQGATTSMGSSETEAMDGVGASWQGMVETISNSAYLDYEEIRGIRVT
ncbi:uncharacterized protein LOC133926787 isoform X1 [Phragmites australis]|uniref:uncharacterized protein LOC133926787 isoform X1 n=1 Tax=Phragmites australis TaxID=29695 RepID=UPI002D77ADB5|nr:uncharacterized protein LOC133926787 isoform X1 [Phragmites australis]